MDDPDMIKPFYKYLDRPERMIPWTKMGLVDNAPPEAVTAYEEYIRYEKERNKNEE